MSATLIARTRSGPAAAAELSAPASGLANTARNTASVALVRIEIAATVGAISSMSRSERATAEATPSSATLDTNACAVIASAKMPTYSGATTRATTAMTAMLANRIRIELLTVHSAPRRTRLPSPSAAGIAAPAAVGTNSSGPSACGSLGLMTGRLATARLLRLRTRASHPKVSPPAPARASRQVAARGARTVGQADPEWGVALARSARLELSPGHESVHVGVEPVRKRCRCLEFVVPCAPLGQLVADPRRRLVARTHHHR